MSCCMGDAAETSTRFREVLSVCDGWFVLPGLLCNIHSYCSHSQGMPA